MSFVVAPDENSSKRSSYLRRRKKKRPSSTPNPLDLQEHSLCEAARPPTDSTTSARDEMRPKPAKKAKAAKSKEIGIDGLWKHDMFQESLRPPKDPKSSSQDEKSPKRVKKAKRSKKKKTDPVEDIRLRMSNLPGDLVIEDISHMFEGFHILDNVMRLDSKGKFMGEADIRFNNNDDAMSAFKHYSNCKIDGAPINLELVSRPDGIQQVVPIADPLSVAAQTKREKKAQKRRHYQVKYKKGEHYDSNFLDRVMGDDEFEEELTIQKQTKFLNDNFATSVEKKQRRFGAMRMDSI